MTRTKENEGLSVSNSLRFCTYLQHPSIRPSLGIMVSFSLNLMLSLPWWLYLAALESYPANKEPINAQNLRLSQSWT